MEFLMGMSLRTAARQEATGASECVRVVRARAGGDHRAALCMRVKVATGGGRGATMDLRATGFFLKVSMQPIECDQPPPYVLPKEGVSPVQGQP